MIYGENGQVVFTYRVNEDITEKEDTIDLYLPLKHATKLFIHLRLSATSWKD
jgi:hypothetical protein